MTVEMQSSAYPEPQPASPDLKQQLMGLTQLMALRALATLGVPDLLARGPLHPAEIARRAGSHAEMTFRFLRSLAGFGFFAEDEHGRFFFDAAFTVALHDGVRVSRR